MLDAHAYDREIDAARRAFPAVPPAIIRAVIATESRFDPQATLAEVGGDGSVGLMQLRPSTARTLGYGGTRESLFLPALNVYYGTALLDRLARTVPANNGRPGMAGEAGDWDAVVSAYNGGYFPELGFGARVTRPTTVCLRRDPRTGECVQRFTAQPGQFGNQAHVDRFRRALSGQAERGGAGWALVVGVAALLLLVVLLFMGGRGI